MRYYLDTEFIENGYARIDLISIGVVAQDGREYYAVASDGWDEANANEWVREHVLPHVRSGPFRTREQIRDDLLAFVRSSPTVLGSRPELWGYYADYDWVVFCQLFGRMIDLPKGWPMFCMDLRQLAADKGNPRLPSDNRVEHHALSDAREIKLRHEFLMGLP